MNDNRLKKSKIFGFIAMAAAVISIPMYFLPIVSLDSILGSEGFNIISAFSYDETLLGIICICVMASALIGAVFIALPKKVFKILGTVFNGLAFAGAVAVLVIAFVNSENVILAETSPGIGAWLTLAFTAIALGFSITATVLIPKEGEEFIETPPEWIGNEYPGGYNGNQLSGNITFLGGSCAGYSVPVMPGDEIVVGKDPAVCNIVIDKSYSTVSRKHVSITFDATSNMYIVTDTSSNGTRVVGGAKLTRGQPAYLDRGTTLNLGKTNNTLRLD